MSIVYFERAILIFKIKMENDNTSIACDEKYETIANPNVFSMEIDRMLNYLSNEQRTEVQNRLIITSVFAAQVLMHAKY